MLFKYVRFLLLIFYLLPFQLYSQKNKTQKKQKITGYFTTGLFTFLNVKSNIQDFNFILSNPISPINHPIHLSSNNLLTGLQINGWEIDQPNGLLYSFLDIGLLFGNRFNGVYFKFFGIGYEKKMPMIFRNLQYLTRNELKYRIGLNLEYVEFRKNNEKDVFSSSTNNNIIINNVNLTNSMYINIGESTIRLTPYIGLKYKLDNNNDLRFQLNYSFNLYNNQYTTCYSHDFHYTKHSHIGTYTDVKNSSFLFNQNGISINNIFSLQPFFFKVEYAFGG